MPFRRKRFGRKKYGAKRRMGAGRSRRPYTRRKGLLSRYAFRGPSGLPDKLFVTLKFNITALLTSTSGAYTSIILKMNSILDPTGSLGSAQPYLRDQWATLFANYRVHWVKGALKFLAAASGESISRSVVVFPTTQSSALASLAEATEQPRGTYRMFQINSSTPYIKFFYRPATILGNTKEQYRTNPNTQAAMSADPASLVYWHIGAADPLFTTTSGTLISGNVFTRVELFNRVINSVS